jgi:hypothetical protein
MWRMTVSAKKSVKVMPGTEVGFKDAYDLKVPWVVEFSGSDGTANYIAGLTYDEKAPGNYDRITGWIGLRTTDAKWLYREPRLGSVIEVEGTAPAAVPTATGASGAGTGASVGKGRRGRNQSGGWAGAGPRVVVPGAVRWPRPVR